MIIQNDAILTEFRTAVYLVSSEIAIENTQFLSGRLTNGMGTGLQLIAKEQRVIAHRVSNVPYYMDRHGDKSGEMDVLKTKNMA